MDQQLQTGVEKLFKDKIRPFVSKLDDFDRFFPLNEIRAQDEVANIAEYINKKTKAVCFEIFVDMRRSFNEQIVNV